MIRAQGARAQFPEKHLLLSDPHLLLAVTQRVATYLHPLTTHELENAKLMHALFWNPARYPEPRVQSGRHQILKDDGLSLLRQELSIIRCNMI